MEEKKLTDDEIVKALECMAGIVQIDCDKCPFFIYRFCSDTELSTEAIDLIRRLHKENEEQKAEIERLKGEKNDWKQRYDSESNRYADLCNASSECVQKKNDRIAELQKQVDELKKRLFDEFEAFKVEAYGKFKKQAVKETAKEIYGLAVDYYDGSEAFDLFLQAVNERYGVEVE